MFSGCESMIYVEKHVLGWKIYTGNFSWYLVDAICGSLFQQSFQFRNDRF